MITFLLTLLSVIQQMLTAYSEQANTTARRNVDAEMNRLLLDEVRRFLKPLLDKGSEELPRVTEQTITHAIDLANRGISLLSRYAADQASDYLEDRALSPVLAAAAGSRLYKALSDLLAVTEAHQQWLDTRFRQQSFLDWARRRPYRPVGPADIDIKLLQLEIALHITESDTERALSDLNQTRNPLKYLVPGIALPSAQTTAPLAGPLAVGVPTGTRPDDSLQIEAPRPRIKEAQQEYSALIDLLKEHVSNIMNDLQTATMPGGGINPHVVRIAIGATLYICVLGLRLVQAQRNSVSILNSKTVEADT